MKVSVVGTGYVGAVTGACLAELGNNVILVDVIKDKVEKINRGIAPIYEDGLDSLLKKNIGDGRLHATTDLRKAVKETEMTIISVGTPSRKDGGIDLVHVERAAEDIGKALKEKKGYHTVVVKSTVVPGTTENTVVSAIEKSSGKRAGRDFGVAMNPEFLKEGLAVRDFMEPDRIVIGGIDEKSIDAVCALYEKFGCPLIRTDPGTAEMIKYASNAFLATKISFINEMGNLCKKLGIDTYAVSDGMGHDGRIERRFLNSGTGYGGSCFPKDVRAIAEKSRESGIEPSILDAAESVNEKQPLKMIEILEEKVSGLRGKTVAVLGLAFKPGTDDVREAPSIKIVKALLGKGANVKAYDPRAAENFKKIHKNITYGMHAKDALEGADCCLLLTEWEEFGNLTDDDFNVMKNKVIIEGRKILDPENVKDFEGVCW